MTAGGLSRITPDDSLEWLFPLGDIADTSYPTFFADVGARATG